MTKSHDDDDERWFDRHDTSSPRIEPVMPVVCLVAAAIVVGMLAGMTWVGLLRTRYLSPHDESIETLEQRK